MNTYRFTLTCLTLLLLMYSSVLSASARDYAKSTSEQSTENIHPNAEGEHLDEDDNDDDSVYDLSYAHRGARHYYYEGRSYDYYNHRQYYSRNDGEYSNDDCDD
jgi:hypothetical protein